MEVQGKSEPVEKPPEIYFVMHVELVSITKPLSVEEDVLLNFYFYIFTFFILDC